MPLACNELVHRLHFHTTLLAYPAVVLRMFEPVGTKAMVVAHEQHRDLILVMKTLHELSCCKGLNGCEGQYLHLSIRH